VVLLGPAHYVAFRGLAASGASAFATPLGEVPVDADFTASAPVQDLPAAHRPEHCLEVELPFLQHVLAGFTIVPLLVGDAADDEVADVLDRLWGGPETLVVVSSDLSHYHDYAMARELDAGTAAAIVALDTDLIDGERACGWRPIRGLLQVARQRGLRCRQLDLRNSGDTAGPRDRVVGYGAFAFEA
jgi:AmmeMemoRadiSam system protein B